MIISGCIHDISTSNQHYISHTPKNKKLFFFKKKLRFFKEPRKKNNFQYLINKNHILRLLYHFTYEI